MDAIRRERFTPFWTITTERWTVGPTVEFRLYRRLSFEVDALFRAYRLGGTFAYPSGPGLSPVLHSTRREVKSWDFPFLLKYRFSDGAVRPFVNAGLSITHESEDRSSTSVCLGPTTCNPPEFPDTPAYNFENIFVFIESTGNRCGWRCRIQAYSRYSGSRVSLYPPPKSQYESGHFALRCQVLKNNQRQMRQS